MTCQLVGLPRPSSPSAPRPAEFLIRAAGVRTRWCPAPSAEVLEAMMVHIVVAVGIGMALAFDLGAVLGIMVMISMGVRREDRRYTLTGPPPDVVTRGVRRLTRLGLRDIIILPETWRGQR